MRTLLLRPRGAANVERQSLRHRGRRRNGSLYARAQHAGNGRALAPADQRAMPISSDAIVGVLDERRRDARILVVPTSESALGRSRDCTRDRFKRPRSAERAPAVFLSRNTGPTAAAQRAPAAGSPSCDSKLLRGCRRSRAVLAASPRQRAPRPLRPSSDLVSAVQRDGPPDLPRGSSTRWFATATSCRSRREQRCSARTSGPRRGDLPVHQEWPSAHALRSCLQPSRQRPGSCPRADQRGILVPPRRRSRRSPAPSRPRSSKPKSAAPPVPSGPVDEFMGWVLTRTRGADPRASRSGV